MTVLELNRALKGMSVASAIHRSVALNILDVVDGAVLSRDLKCTALSAHSACFANTASTSTTRDHTKGSNSASQRARRMTTPPEMAGWPLDPFSAAFTTRIGEWRDGNAQ